MSSYLRFASVFLILVILSCQKEKSFEQGKSSKGSLQGAFGDCLAKTVWGTYTAGKALNDSNYIDVTVDVTEGGSYLVYTDTVNGYFFRASGTFTTVGSNSVRLKGFGTPGAEGNNTFTVFFDSTICVLDVSVLPAGSGGGPVPSNDHFILTDNSWWSYNFPIAPGDTLKRSIISGTFASGSFIYKGMKQLDAAGQLDDTLFFRKSGNNYYELNYVDYYTSIFLDNPAVDSILFLKEGLTTGDAWSSPVYTGTEGGQSRKVRYDFTCTNANATTTINSKTYNNVYQVSLKVMVDSGTGFATDMTWTNYYAQGIGWIYQKGDDGAGGAVELPIRNYRVF